MNERIKLNEVVVVEGRYDKIRLETVVDAIIITTEGFGVFNDKEKQAMLRKLAAERGLLVLTDSDAAGFVIRRFLNGCIEPSLIKHAYIPPIIGKEKRKSKPSKEGLLGVEGIDCDVLRDSLKKAGVDIDCNSNGEEQVNNADVITREVLFDDGFIGAKNSAQKRALLLEALDMPSYLSVNALLQIINLVTTRSGYRQILASINEQIGN